MLWKTILVGLLLKIFDESSQPKRKENGDSQPYIGNIQCIFDKFASVHLKDDNAYITEYLNGSSPPEEETNAMQEPMEEEIAEFGSSLDENEEESEE